MKKNYFLKGICLFVLIFIISCSKDSESDVTSINSKNENFIQLAMAKEIAGSVSFEKNNGATSKSTGFVEQIKKTIKTINEVKNESGNTSFYVINYNEGGFIILSADNRTEPILAFSEEGQFTVNEAAYPLGLKYWMTDAKKQINDIQHSNSKQTALTKQMWKKIKLTSRATDQNATNQNKPASVPIEECYEHTETTTIGPLLNTTWYQTGGFNSALGYINCSGSNFQVYAGCVPIAMAQVMKYYSYPTRYDWSAMPTSYATTTTANLILDIHNSIKAAYPPPFGTGITYNCDGTGVSSSYNMGAVLKGFFGYTRADWANYDQETVKNNLNYGRPVILSGSGASGHMWVCDGYLASNFYFDDCTGVGTLMLRMNWGWYGGYNNGWYAFDNFNPGGSTYNNNRKMIYNITP